jgi:hypothetical protein
MLAIRSGHHRSYRTADTYLGTLATQPAHAGCHLVAELALGLKLDELRDGQRELVQIAPLSTLQECDRHAHGRHRSGAGPDLPVNGPTDALLPVDLRVQLLGEWDSESVERGVLAVEHAELSEDEGARAVRHHNGDFFGGTEDKLGDVGRSGPVERRTGDEENVQFGVLVEGRGRDDSHVRRSHANGLHGRADPVDRDIGCVRRSVRSGGKVLPPGHGEELHRANGIDDLEGVEHDNADGEVHDLHVL